MKHMKINPELLVTVDFNNQNLPTSVQLLKPTVFREGGAYCAIFGPDPQKGIFGCGNTVQEALQDWDSNLAHEIDNPRDDNETTRYILDNLNAF